MLSYIKNLASWPTTDEGEPIFTTSNEAILYAQLIWDHDELQLDLIMYREQTYKELRHYREKYNPDLDVMMGLAVKAQFFRESYMEALRIMDEKLKLKLGV